MTTSNEQFLDAMIRHQIFLLRLSGSIRNKVLSAINATEADVKAQLLVGLEGIADGGALTPAKQRRLENTLKKVTALRLEGWKLGEKVWLDELKELAVAEPAFVAAAVQTVAPVVVDVSLPDSAQLRAIATATPFEGRTLKEWARNVRDADIDRIQRMVQIGMVQGETPQQIAARVVGTAALKGRDGVTQISRRNAEAITRTAVNHVSNAAKRALYVANSDIFTEEQYVSTLDGNTTAVCRGLDGKRFKVGKGPIPPLHFGCRSLRVAVIRDTLFGDRPIKPATERTLIREYNAKHGLSARRRADLPRGHKGRFDQFSRDRLKVLIGRVPADTTYAQFLRRQPVAFQEDVLGRTKARLFRQGNLPLDRFVDRAGSELNLSQLASREKDAFVSAGLDPEDFL